VLGMPSRYGSGSSWRGTCSPRCVVTATVGRVSTLPPLHRPASALNGCWLGCLRAPSNLQDLSDLTPDALERMKESDFITVRAGRWRCMRGNRHPAPWLCGV